jgi:pilus assembly protein Flp/PilA
MRHFLRLVADDDGTTAVEYAVMLALIIAVCISAVSSVGSTNDGSLKDSMGKLGAVMGTSSS